MKLLILFISIYSTSLWALVLGIERHQSYLPILQNKKVAIVSNQSSRLGNTHLIDFLISKKINVKKLFALEHGLRGSLDPGETVGDGIDEQTGLPIISLYGKRKQPSSEDLRNIDFIVFDIQDVGVRFYTYLSSLHEIIEAAAKNNKKVMILDRPNPNDDYIDGPVLNPKFSTFLGKHPIPLVHGMTLGELAIMIVNEGWVQEANLNHIHVISMLDYKHGENQYNLPVYPSPNLRTMNAIRWYPTLALFEPTTVSLGRGTYKPFLQVDTQLLEDSAMLLPLNL
jgi:uncharacterized protein YbbC (DUF1343 family)